MSECYICGKSHKSNMKICESGAQQDTIVHHVPAKSTTLDYETGATSFIFQQHIKIMKSDHSRAAQESGLWCIIVKGIFAAVSMNST